MPNNGPPHWRNPRAPQANRPDRDGELLAALEQTDLTEPMRAAVTHALSNPTEGADPTNALVDRYLTERERQSRPTRPTNDPRSRYTLHLTFPAGNLNTARAKAISYAEGLAALRPEIGTSPPLLSRADTWNHVEPLFCGATGPDGGNCTGAPGHPGPHRAG